jgi:hypothetical protein
LTVHTLIPEADTYGVAILVVYGLGSSSLAVHIHSRWLAGRRTNFWTVRNLIQALTVVWGLSLFAPGQIFGNSLTAWSLSIPAGVVAGWTAGWAEQIIIRRSSRWQLVLANQSGPKGSSTVRRTGDPRSRRVRPAPTPTAGVAKKRDIGIRKGWESFRLGPAEMQFGFWSIMIASVLEELVYRGFLVQACFLLANRFLLVMALAGTLLVFAISHVQFGWLQVLAKLPLGALALMTVLSFETVLPAIVAHIIFNCRVWKKLNEEGKYEEFPHFLD